MEPAETYRRRAERAELACENFRDPQAKRLLREAAQRWRQLAQHAEAQKEQNDRRRGVTDTE
jgi:hypothetical protein